MISSPKIVTTVLAVLVVMACLPALADDSPAAIQQKLTQQYQITKPTADKTDIVTAGSVLVLEKDNLLMFTVTTTIPPVNTYKNGKISHGVFDAAKKCKFCAYVPGVSAVTAQVPNVDQRTFVAGEKFWVTGIEAHDDGMVFDLLSDPYSDVRYYSQLKIPYPKSGMTADAFLATVAEVIKVQPDDSGDKDAKGGGSQAPAGQQQQQQQQTPGGGQPENTAATTAPIAPPPPPPDAAPAAPKTIEKGQTRDMVVAILGQPTKVIKLGTKEIDVYPDMKVTFVNNKVSDVQ